MIGSESGHDRAIGGGKSERGSGVFIRDQPQTNSEQETRLQLEIEATDRQIDQLVYELYRLTGEAIRIVKEAVEK